MPYHSPFEPTNPPILYWPTTSTTLKQARARLFSFYTISPIPPPRSPPTQIFSRGSKKPILLLDSHLPVPRHNNFQRCWHLLSGGSLQSLEARYIDRDSRIHCIIP